MYGLCPPKLRLLTSTSTSGPAGAPVPPHPYTQSRLPSSPPLAPTAPTTGGGLNNCGWTSYRLVRCPKSWGTKYYMSNIHPSPLPPGGAGYSISRASAGARPAPPSTRQPLSRDAEAIISPTWTSWNSGMMGILSSTCASRS